MPILTMAKKRDSDELPVTSSSKKPPKRPRRIPEGAGLSTQDLSTPPGKESSKPGPLLAKTLTQADVKASKDGKRKGISLFISLTWRNYLK